MENTWQISKGHKMALDALFSSIENEKIESVLDVGSGRTSIEYLTTRFPNLIVRGVIYPGDRRKIDPIKECVKNKNYEIIESDIKDIKIEKNVDVVCAHLFLGEAGKFGGNNFTEVCHALFKIKTKYLVLINLFSDSIDYNILLSEIAEKGKITRLYSGVSDGGDKFIGMTISFNE